MLQNIKQKRCSFFSFYCFDILKSLCQSLEKKGLWDNYRVLIQFETKHCVDMFLTHYNSGLE